MPEVRKVEDMNLRELRDSGMKLFKQMEDLYREKRESGKDLTSDKEQQFEKINSDMSVIEERINMLEKKELFERQEAARGPKLPGSDDIDIDEYDPKFNPDQRTVNRALRKFKQREGKMRYLNAQEKKIITLNALEEDAFESFLRSGLRPENMEERDRSIFMGMQKRHKGIEKRAQSTTTTAGGYTIPQGFIPKIIVYMKYISAFFQEMQEPNEAGEFDTLFDVYRTESGNTLPVATNDDTGSIGELIAENGDASSSNGDFTFGQKTFYAYKYSSKMVKVSNELLEDTGLDLTGYLSKQMGTRLGRILNSQFTNGTGSSQPTGITVGISVGKVAGSTGALSFPEIIQLVHSVDPSYRASPSCRFMLHDLILSKLKQATVGTTTYNNRPLWAPGWDVGAPPTIDGHQYVINQDMDSTIASGKKIMLFGDMKTFGVRWVNELRLIRLTERYAELDQVAFLGLLRADAKLLNTSGIKFYAGT
ncbi:MAG: phage major capsid protein [Patescibacteria group bacterium]|nr:phage major capsid protein [Patescibacteria group bacterium]